MVRDAGSCTRGRRIVVAVDALDFSSAVTFGEIPATACSIDLEGDFSSASTVNERRL